MRTHFPIRLGSLRCGTWAILAKACELLLCEDDMEYFNDDVKYTPREMVEERTLYSNPR